MTSATTTKGRAIERGRVPLCLTTPLSVLDRSISAALSRGGFGHKGNMPLSPLHPYELPASCRHPGPTDAVPTEVPPCCKQTLRTLQRILPLERSAGSLMSAHVRIGGTDKESGVGRWTLHMRGACAGASRPRGHPSSLNSDVNALILR